MFSDSMDGVIYQCEVKIDALQNALDVQRDQTQHYRAKCEQLKATISMLIPDEQAIAIARQDIGEE